MIVKEFYVSKDLFWENLILFAKSMKGKDSPIEVIKNSVHIELVFGPASDYIGEKLGEKIIEDAEL